MQNISCVKKYIFPAGAVALVSAFPAAFLYFQNADQADFSEVSRFLFGSIFVSLLAFSVLATLTHKIGKASLSVSLVMMLILNFFYVEAAIKLALPDLKYWHTSTISVIAVLHIVYFLWRFLEDDLAMDVTKVLCFVFGGLLLLNAATATPQIIERVQAQQKMTVEMKIQSKQTIRSGSDMPNVYLIIFDEYANFPQMEECYNYDNAPLKDFLKDHKFNISYTSYNESIRSDTVQTNMVNLDYIVDDETPSKTKEVLRHNGILFDVMKNHGYDVQILESSAFYGGYVPDGSTSSASTINGETIEMLLWQKTIFYPFFQLNNPRRMRNVRNSQEIASLLETQTVELSKTFTLAYFCLPHQPFVVDENGNQHRATIYDTLNIWNNKKYYLDQFKYTTKLMLPILESIVENDPQAVIMLMSDHGARDAPGATWDLKRNSLNVLYYQGEEYNIEGLSNVNTIRATLNNLLDEDYEMVPVPTQEEIG